MAGKNIAKAAESEAFDLMAFQECEDVSWPLRDAKNAGVVDDYATIVWNVKPFMTAVAIRTSVFDILAQGKVEVADDSHHQYYGRRGVIWARLHHKPSGRYVFFVNHHGPTPVNTGGLCGNAATAYNILKVIATNAMVGDAVLLAGDFNAAWMIGGFGHSWEEEVGRIDCHLDHMFANPVNDDMWGIDNFFASCAKLVNKTVLPKGGSDHYALSAVFEI
jgi:endonuclease/exonuclease/phosphatase (EEP) superfamily protein YafD